MGARRITLRVKPPIPFGEVTMVPAGLIPSLIDQNPCAHWRKPMDMMRQGCSTSLFHASQQ